MCFISVKPWLIVISPKHVMTSDVPKPLEVANSRMHAGRQIHSSSDIALAAVRLCLNLIETFGCYRD
jgi:hypothetical protein